MSDDHPVTFQTADGLTLEGVLHLPAATAAPGIVVCHPHPLYGGDMHNNVVSIICRVALEGGIAALRFNFRGAGRSAGRHERGEGERLDAAGAVAFLRGLPEVDADRVALAGYSFGAAVALNAGLTGLTALVAVSAPTMALPAEPPPFDCPVLLVSGDGDEYSDEDDITEFARAAGAELVVVRHADHFWWGGEDRLAEAVRAFLARHVA